MPCIWHCSSLLQTWKFSAFQLISAFFVAQIYALSFIFSPIWAILLWFQAVFQLFWAFSVFLTKDHFHVCYWGWRHRGIQYYVQSLWCVFVHFRVLCLFCAFIVFLVAPTWPVQIASCLMKTERFGRNVTSCNFIVFPALDLICISDIHYYWMTENIHH